MPNVPGPESVAQFQEVIIIIIIIIIKTFIMGQQTLHPPEDIYFIVLPSSHQNPKSMTVFTTARHVPQICAIDQHSPSIPTDFFKIRCHIVIPSTPRSPKNTLYDL